MPSVSPSVYTLAEAATMLRIGRTSAYAAVKSGEFPVPVLKIGGRIVVPAAPLRELLGLPPLGEEVSA